MTVYTWRNGWAMREEQVEADTVTFESSGHVVFWRRDPSMERGLAVVLARDSRYVDNLKPVEP